MPSKKKRLVVVSNRVPYITEKKAQAGGMAVGLREVLETTGGIWFGWSGKVSDSSITEPTVTRVSPITYVTIDLSRKDYNQYYNGFANQVLWPLFHYRLDLTSFNRNHFLGYERVNGLFATKLSKLLKKNDLIWVHDYHLIPLGNELRKRGQKQTIGFFFHTPFPALEVMTALPLHGELMEQLCAYDLIGFQTDNDLRAFIDYIRHEAGGRVVRNKHVEVFGYKFKIGVFPIGINPEHFAGPIRDSKQITWMRKLKHRYGDIDWLIGVDRLDYSKGINERFRAFERLLERYPGYQSRVTFIQITPPSRSDIREYREIRHELEAEAGHINGRFGELDWLPINYINRSYTREQLATFYRASRIGLVTPFRDGMNLVAKEYVASQNPEDPGVLVLSRFAGAARELESALIVNPYDFDSIADTIARGLEMSLGERRERWDVMIKVLRRNDLAHWRDSYLRALHHAGKKG
jgi:trehalose 6-phosphate synthase